MSEGQIIYNGLPTGIKNRIFDLGFKFPKYVSPADFIMKIIDKEEFQIQNELEGGEAIEDFDIIENQYRDRMRFIINYERQDKKQNLEYKRYIEINNGPSELSAKDLFANSKVLQDEKENINLPRNLISQFFILLLLYSSYFYKKKMNYMLLLGNMLFVNFLVMFLYQDLGDPERNTIPAIQNRRGLCYMLTIQGAYTGMTYFIHNFIVHRKLFLKDKDARLYSELPFFLAQLSYLVPLFVLLYLVAIVVYYLIVDLNQEPGLYINALQNYFFMFVGGYISGVSFSAVLGALCEKLTTFIALVPLVVVPFAMCTGYFTNLRTATKPIQWLSYLNPMRFAYQGNMLIEFQNSQKYLESCVAWTDCPNEENKKCAVKLPEQIHDQCDPKTIMDFVQDDVLTNILFICILILFNGSLAYLALKLKSKYKRMRYRKNPKLRKKIVSDLEK